MPSTPTLEPLFHDSDVPDDILIEIFIHLTSSPWKLPPERNEPRIVLPQVCSRWKTLLHQYVPEAWTKIEYYHDSTWGSAVPLGKRAGRRLLDTWIPRAKSLPLSIKISLHDETPYYYRSKKKVFHPIHDLVVSHSTRIRKLEFKPAAREAVPTFFTIDPSLFPRLEELHIVGVTNPAWPHAPRNGPEYPALRSVHVQRWHGTLGSGPVTFPWRDLVRLKLDHPISFNLVESIFRYVQHSLEELKFTLPEQQDSSTLSTPRITLQSLRSLALSPIETRTERKNPSIEVTDAFLGMLIAPKLTSLKWAGEGLGWSHTALCDLINRSSCSMEALDVRMEELWDTIQVTGTTLKSLGIKFQDTVPSIPPGILKDVISGKVVSKLESLSISVYKHDSTISLFLFVDRVLGMVKRRLRASREAGSTLPHLRSVTFSLPRAFLSAHPETYDPVILALARGRCLVRIADDEQPFFYRILG